MSERKKRIVVGISGASGAVIGVRLLAALRRLGLPGAPLPIWFVVLRLQNQRAGRGRQELGIGSRTASIDAPHTGEIRRMAGRLSLDHR